MKRNQNFDHNHSQKVLSCRYNMDTNRAEARFEDGTILSIDCIVIEDEYGNTPAQRAELDWLLKLYQKIEGCSGILQVKCNRCKETLRLDLAFRCR